jgi:hypothetical protein
MNACHKIKPQDLQAYVDGELTGPGKARLEEHLKICPECRALAEELSRVVRAVSEAECEGAPEGYFDDFSSRVASGIAAKSKARPGRTLWHLLGWPTVPLAAAAALALAFTASRLMMTGPAPEGPVAGREYSRALPDRQLSEAGQRPEEVPARQTPAAASARDQERPASREAIEGRPGKPTPAPPAGLMATGAAGKNEKKSVASPPPASSAADNDVMFRQQEQGAVERPADAIGSGPGSRTRDCGTLDQSPRMLRTTPVILICLPSDRPDAGPPEIGTALEISLPGGS